MKESLQRYRQPEGFEGDLVEAAWQLEQIGNDSWPALSELVFSGVPECEFFLGAIVRIEGESAKVRRSLLLHTAKNPDANVRSRLLELIRELPPDLEHELLTVLTADERPEDPVLERARDAMLQLSFQAP